MAISIPRKTSIPSPPLYLLMNGSSSTSKPSSCFEIRLFYVRISPCVIDNVPEFLTIRHLRREIGVSMEINGSRIPASDRTSLTLRRDRIDKEASEVTYVSTDSIRVTGAVEFEVYERDDLILCGSLERMDWSNGGGGGLDNHHQQGGLEKDEKTGWSMDCYMASGVTTTLSAFFQPKLGISSPSIEVYVAGCCSGVPLILTKIIQHSPKRKPRHGGLDAIPEDDETGKENGSTNGSIRHRNFQVTDQEVEEYDSERKFTNGFYSDEFYTDEDGQLTWFNAGVRVGVGIGLGMCLGIGIGVGLLMRSYQATTKTFRRRFF
ncbi:Erythronate-4-phosphate dehydrogenase family protein [Thalictrum thalictroides]|uniref:Erythronate-4-phosphate dehydrogenase family protein n=1 Tax=Thalictrum thalictroides TaxID=46969 RepID=A0A7J6WAX6_THATH|nr:Erythronate-4-phosphate dehydrogenase family protein [Thalictrum thalictroides]